MDYLVLFTRLIDLGYNFGYDRIIVFIATIAVLLVALRINIKISKRNHLYLKQKKEDKLLNVVKENEVA